MGVQEAKVTSHDSIHDIPIERDLKNMCISPLLFSFAVLFLHAQPTGNVLYRLYVAVNGELGTAFVMDYGDRQLRSCDGQAQHGYLRQKRATVELKGPGPQMVIISGDGPFRPNKCR